MNFVKGELVGTNGEVKFASQDITLRIPKDFQEYVRHAVGGKVTMGIRPVDIYESPALDGESSEIQCKVDFRELMGSETFLYLRVGKTPLIARASATTDAHAGSTVPLHVNLRCIHFYDEVSQTAIL